MALTKSSSAGTNVTDIAEARRNREQTQITASGDFHDPPDDEASASMVTPDKNGNRRFDKEKVERIKAEIAEGRYKIDHARVADKFIEHERNS